MAWEIVKNEKTTTVEIPNVCGVPLALFFTPDAIRDHFDCSEFADKVDAMTDDDLMRFGLESLSCESIYKAFDMALVACLGLDEESE